MTTQQQDLEQRIREIENSISHIDAILLNVSSKEDVQAGRADQERLRAEVMTSLESLRAQLMTEIERLRTELEHLRGELGARLERLEANQEQFATKEDVERLRAEMYRMEARLIRWVVASAIASVAAMAAIGATVATVLIYVLG